VEDLMVGRVAALAVLAIACGDRGAAPTTPIAPTTPTAPTPPAQGGDRMVTTTLELTPDGAGWSLAFALKNTTTHEVQGQILEPFASFELEVATPAGEKLSLVQPAFNVPGRLRPLVLAPGASARVETPFRLRFDPAVAPSGGSDAMVWSIRSAKVPVQLRASFEVPGLGPQVATGHID
jgi:hypothetical protein